MKHLLFSLLLLISSFAFSQAVTIAATDGGSVTLTPEGVVRSQPTAATRALVDKTKAAKKNVVVPVVKPLDSFQFSNIGIAEARMVFRAYSGVRDDENATAEDLKTADALRKFIIENKGFANSTKKISVTVSAARIDRVFATSSYQSRSELQKELRQLDIEEGLFKQVAKQEELAGIVDENSVLRNQKDKFK